MNMYILFKMFVLCYFVILTCRFFFDKINVLLLYINDEVIPNHNISLSVFSMYGTITV